MLILLLARHSPRQRASRFGLNGLYFFSRRGITTLTIDIPVGTYEIRLSWRNSGCVTRWSPQQQRTFSYRLTFREPFAIQLPAF